MNIKLRLKNKATLLALLLAVVAFAYQICGIIGIVVPISQEEAIQVIGVALNLLVAIGVLVDPTTAGLRDSDQAMEYIDPHMDVEYLTDEDLEASLQDDEDIE